MGGPGSGRYEFSMKTTVDECRALDVHDFHDEGRLTPGERGTCAWSQNGEEVATIGWQVTGTEDHPQLWLKYAAAERGGSEHEISYATPITHTECNFGGERPWFECPGPPQEDCGERVGKLYKPPGELRFLCRHCYDLAYESQQRQGEMVFEDLSKPFRRQEDAMEAIRDGPVTREQLREYYEARKEVKEGLQTAANFQNELFGPVPVEVEPLPPFEEWLDDICRQVHNELYGRDYGLYGQCEATAQSTGDRCRQPAAGDHGKCYYHGGAAGSGAPEGNQNAAAD